ncbi:MAG: nuclear transport factor 2 family protein [Bacteroidota bacterium]
MQWIVIFLFVLPGVFQFPANFERADADPEKEVENVIMGFFDSMRESDRAGMRSFLAEDATLKTVTMDEQDSTILRQTDIVSFLDGIGQSDAGSLDEQLTSFVAHVDGGLATAWVEYRFYNAGEFSHCGVNSMNLIRKDSGWKIFSIVDTRRKEGC